MNHILIKVVTDNEIKEAVFAIHLNKAPGSDGITSKFCKDHWVAVKDDVYIAAKSIFVGGVLPKSFNHMVISFIPKTNVVEHRKQLRPISLSTIFYKIVSNIMAKRLCGVKEKIVSENQSAFLKGRLISDNILVAHELMHYLKNKRRGKKQEMAIKQWINWIMKCISSLLYSVLINKGPQRFIKPTRGLRQGDPLSPYLSLLCTEGLSFMLKEAEAKRKFQGPELAEETKQSLTFCLQMTIFCSVEHLSQNVVRFQKF